MAEPASLPEARRRGYEPTEVSVRGVLLVALGFFVAIGLSAVLVSGMIRLFDALRTPGPVPALERTELVPPPPRLEAEPAQTLREVRAHEQMLLENYGWVDRDTGIAHIPIERAMAILAERGWPQPVTGASAVPAPPDRSGASYPSEQGRAAPEAGR